MDTRRQTTTTAEAPHGWRRTLTEIIAPGVAGGWLAGLAMLVVALVHAAAMGLGALWPLHRVATAALGDIPMTVGTVLLGLALHFLVAAVWGVLFVAVVPRGAPYHMAVLMGLIYGAVVFLVMTWLVLPQADPGMFRAVPNWALFLYHLLFGAVLSVAIPFRRQVSSQHAAADQRAAL